jgi:ribosome-associated toxin RatA of RatAB toxin-antitoxin module
MEVRRVVLVEHPADRMYDLIEGAEHYPAFLPWCARATILERTDTVVAATIGIDWHGLRFDIITRNRKRRPEWLEVVLERGPFRQFRGEWQLKPLGSIGCRIDFVLRYEFASEIVGRAAGPTIERVANRMVDAFVHRADALGERIPRLDGVAASAPAGVDELGAYGGH